MKKALTSDMRVIPEKSLQQGRMGKCIRLEEYYFEGIVMSLGIWTWNNLFLIPFPLHFRYTQSLVGGGCRIHRLLLCRRFRPRMSVLDITLSELMVRLNQCRSFRDGGVTLHCNPSQVQFDPVWQFLIYGWNRTVWRLHCVQKCHTLNWIVKNRIICQLNCE